MRGRGRARAARRVARSREEDDAFLDDRSTARDGRTRVARGDGGGDKKREDGAATDLEP